MRVIISLICLLLPFMALAEEVQIRPDAPDHHVVVKGDTLWGISAMFYKNPWKWPQIWNINKDSVKNPHWIYPGNMIVLDRSNGSLHVAETGNAGETPASIADAASSPAPAAVEGSQNEGSKDGAEKLSPRIRYEPSAHDAIPTIPFKVIQPFLSQPLVLDEDMEDAPVLVAFEEGRVILGTDQKAYVEGLTESMGNKLQVFRPGKELLDPETEEILGREAVYLGDVYVQKFGGKKLGEVSTVVATKARQEINLGDYLYAPTVATMADFQPHAPEVEITASVISIYGGGTQAGQNTVVTINKGERDGLHVGHVLALYGHGKQVKHRGEDYVLPDERYGLMFVFRTFRKVSYALVMETRLPVYVLDRAQTP